MYVGIDGDRDGYIPGGSQSNLGLFSSIYSKSIINYSEYSKLL